MFDAFTAQFGRSASNILPALRLVYADATGNDEDYKRIQAEIKENNRVAYEAAPNLVSLDEIKETYDKEGLFSAAAKVVEFGGEKMGESLGFMGPSLVAALGVGAAATVAAPLLGGAISAAALSFGAGAATRWTGYLADNASRAYEQGDITTEDFNLLKSAAAAGGQTSLDALSFLLVGGGTFAKELTKGTLLEGGPQGFFFRSDGEIFQPERCPEIRRHRHGRRGCGAWPAGA